MLGWFNFLILRWTGFRLAQVAHSDGRITWSLMGPVLPLTGWRTPYVGGPVALWVSRAA
jgi:hypothetical protein